jgi:hypothetical protein
MVIECGNACFSPIAHSHHIADHMGNYNDSEFWIKMGLSFIESWADELWVLQLQGWDRSKGVGREIAAAKKIGIPVRFI